MDNLLDLYDDYSAEQYEFYMLMQKEFNEKEINDV